LQSTLPAAIGSGANLSLGGSLFLRRCAGCHGAVGRGVADEGIPRLAGQHASYLLRQMQESASGGRPNMTTAHTALLDRLDYQSFEGIADYLSRMTPAP
jgi:cytochrome c553